MYIKSKEDIMIERFLALTGNDQVVVIVIIAIGLVITIGVVGFNIETRSIRKKEELKNQENKCGKMS